MTDATTGNDGCGGGCACAARRARGEVAAVSSDLFSSVALASEILSEPGDEYVNNLRSLWSSLTPGNLVFAAGINNWAPVDGMLLRWFSSNEATLEFAVERYENAFVASSQKICDAHRQSIREKVDGISQKFQAIAPLLAREKALSRRGDAAGAENCALERENILRQDLVPALELSKEEAGALTCEWYRNAMEWCRCLAGEMLLERP